MIALRLTTIATLFAAIHAATAPNVHAATTPNILILFADDLGSGDLQVYGHPTTRTPHLDALAASGIRFTQWYSAFHVCSPSRAAMMTGRLPIRSGLAGGTWTGGVIVANAAGGLPHNETTIAEALKPKGYAALALGKWHLGQQPEYLPTSHGFDEYLGLPYSDDMGSSAWDYYDSEGNPPLPLLHSTAPGKVTIVEQPTDLNLLSGRYVHAATSFITNQTSAKKPWLLYMAFSHVHTPDFASKPFCNQTLRGRFGDALLELDDAVGTIMASVKSSGALSSTLTFFTSDNGPWLIRSLAGGSAGLLREGKQTTWEGGIREPGIISWPGTIQAGQISSAVVTTYDLFPTILSIVGVPLPTDRIIDGKDLTPLLFGKNATSPHECVFHWKGAPWYLQHPISAGCPKGNPKCEGLWAARCGPYKLHYYTMDSVGVHAFKPIKHDPPLIYQIEHDPSEAHPLLNSSEEYVNVRVMLEKAMADHEASVAYVPNQNARGGDNKLKVCCDWDSKKKYPKYPTCTCDAANFEAFVCAPVGPHEDEVDDVVVAASGGSSAVEATHFDAADCSTWPWRDGEQLRDA